MSNLPRFAVAAAAAGASLVAMPAAAAPNVRTFNTDLTGRNQQPGPGDPNARGHARITVNLNSRQVCTRLTETGIARPTAAHIHSGRAGTSGPPVVTLVTPTGGSSKACTKVSRALARDILDHPRAFYVNVHSKRFPDGAIRGQLVK
jgi:hypothetical protein